MLKKWFGFSKEKSDPLEEENGIPLLEDAEAKEDPLEVPTPENVGDSSQERSSSSEKIPLTPENTKPEGVKTRAFEGESARDADIVSDSKNDSTREKDTETQQEEGSSDVAEDQQVDFFARLKAGLSKTTQNLSGKIDALLRGHTKINEEVFEELEEILITSDVGYETTMVLSQGLRKRIREKRIEDVFQIKEELSTLIEESLLNENQGLTLDPSPAILIIVGVNGVGKTTTIGKLASQIKSSGKTVLLVAADTFRAAAAEQLEEWGRRARVPVIRQQEGTDPSAVVFDGIQAAKAQAIDVLICDTAGRLHNKKNLMQELGKIFRIVDREYPKACKEVLLVIDATTGQNAIAQAKTFMEVAPLTGLILTKLDGTARGGVVIGIHEELHLPIKYVGVGEKIEDLQAFDPKNFAQALFQNQNS